MGVTRRFKHKKTAKSISRTTNLYHRLLIKLYAFLNRRSHSEFNKIVLKRLNQSNVNRPPVSLQKVAYLLRGKNATKIAVVVGTVTNDIRLLEVPKKITVCALHVTETARHRIEANGGKVLTFDQLALQRPSGSNTMLIRGRRNAREVVKHFGTPGAKGRHSKPYTRSKGIKFERARGRRNSTGFHI